MLRRYGFDLPRGLDVVDAYYEVGACAQTQAVTVRCPLGGRAACVVTASPPVPHDVRWPRPR